jgi:FkbM family methyltransferase
MDIRRLLSKFSNNHKNKRAITESKIATAIRNSNNRKIAYLGDYKALTTTIFGHQILVDTRDLSISPHILNYGYWEIWITKAFMELVEEGMTVVEVGANVGYYTLLASSLVGETGKVYAFEATPNTFNNLFHTIDLNGFTERVTLVNKAVFNKSNEKFQLNTLEKCHGGNTLASLSEEYLKRRLENKPKTIEIDSVCLDDFFDEGSAFTIDLIKIDAQGSEPYIFEGMHNILKNNPHVKIIIEFEPDLIKALGVEPELFIDDILQQEFTIMIIDPFSGIIPVTRREILNQSNCELLLLRSNIIK